MSTALLAAVAVILCILFRILNVNSQPQKPALYCKDLNFLETILKIAPLLHEPYVNTQKIINEKLSFSSQVRAVGPSSQEYIDTCIYHVV